MNRQRERAIALVTTLAALAVVIMLMGAFFLNWQSHIAMSRYSAEKKDCGEALSSLADACRFQLEGNRDWGKVAGAETDAMEFLSRSGEPLLILEPMSAEGELGDDFQGMSGLAFFSGESRQTGVKIALAIVNNLDNRLPMLDQRVGAKACRIQIRVRKGGYTEWVEVTLRRAGFFDSTVLASKKIEIDADRVEFSSADPLRNQIRSESEIFLPDTPLLKFTPAEDALTAETGTVWSKDDIHIGGDSGEQKRRGAAETTGADFFPNAPSYYKIPELRKSDIDYESGKPTVNLASANYMFNDKQSITFKDTRGNEYTREIRAVLVYQTADQTWGPLSKFHFLQDPLNSPDPSDPDPDAYAPDLNTVVIEGVTGIPETDPEFELDGIDCDLSANKFTLDARPEYRVSGDFGIVNGSLEFTDVAADPTNPVEGFLSVDRDLSINGQIYNGGKLVAGRNVYLSPYDVKVDKLEETSDIAIFAGNDVIVRPTFTDEDPHDAQRYFVFKGLVYAGNDFKFLSSLVRNGTTYQFDRKLYIEGALVAKRGEVQIKGNETVELRYNREFLDDLLENPQDRGVVQLEVLAWRPL